MAALLLYFFCVSVPSVAVEVLRSSTVFKLSSCRNKPVNNAYNFNTESSLR
jgi:hypothetical protein